ncbi:UNVERIFIED_CONTAM: hypothetical protein FKN15_003822 [Acipenser sinensis]
MKGRLAAHECPANESQSIPCSLFTMQTESSLMSPSLVVKTNINVPLNSRRPFHRHSCHVFGLAFILFVLFNAEPVVNMPLSLLKVQQPTP